MTEKLRVAIRGFANGVPKFVDHIEIGEDEFDELVPALARKHGAAMAAHALTMIEIEFVDGRPSLPHRHRPARHGESGRRRSGKAGGRQAR